ncbi:MAG: M61 family metallopeptidase [Opitutaceae bacterium]|nr:M61 family metallopeptidase [Opitutaceae bacterium]
MLRCLAFLLGATLATAAGRTPIDYTLHFTAAASHYVDVEAVIPTGGQAQLTLFMPVWTPGSYLVREYARNIIAIEARSDAGTLLPITKITKNRWTVEAAGQTQVRVKYRLYSRDLNVRGNWVESDFAVINGAATFITEADAEQRPYRVRLEMPAGWTTCQTPLTPGAAADTFTAADFDELVDSPIVAGSPLVNDFEVEGVRHVLVTVGGDGVWDNPRVTRNLARLVEEQSKFWGGLPYRTPYYFFNLLAIGRGGLEHKQSTVMGADRWNSRTRGGINSWLSLASHEFFHVWNGKRLRPVELGPFDYEHEAYTPSLWIVEGVTSYYQHLILRRAGFTTRSDYLKSVSSTFGDVQKSPARLVQSLSDASFDSWIKAYRPDENSVNVLFSYYGGGALAMLLLDTEVRRVSDGAKSLDDVMRAAYSRYSGEKGYTEAQFIALAGEVAGQDLGAWFKRVVQTPGEWDYTPFLDWYGLSFETPKPEKSVSPNGIEPPDPPGGWLGADTKVQDGLLMVTAVRTGTPAASAGLSAGDEIIGIDDHRVPAGQLGPRLGAYKAGDAIILLVSRRERLMRLPVTLAEEPVTSRSLKIREDATEAQKARLRAWIGEDPAPATKTEPKSETRPNGLMPVQEPEEAPPPVPAEPLQSAQSGT